MTAIYFPDIVVHSANRQYRLEANSPDNDPHLPADEKERRDQHSLWGGFQRDFVYRCYDQQGNTLLWERDQARDECSPIRAWISDCGEAVIATKHAFTADLLLLDREGTRVFRTHLHDDEKNGGLGQLDYHWTSAGSYWYAPSFQYFAQLDETPHWCCRFLSGRRIVVRLDEPAYADLGLLPSRELLEAETAWARAVLKDARLDWPADVSDDDFPALATLVKAIVLAGLCGDRDSLPRLRQLEASMFENRYTSARCLGEGMWISFLNLRQAAQRSMRRLGHEPRGYSATRFFRHGEHGERVYLNVDTHLPDRLGRALTLSPGNTAHEVLQKVGAPDAGWAFSWEYHFAHPEPRRLLLDFDGALVKSLAWREFPRQYCDREDYVLLG